MEKNTFNTEQKMNIEKAGGFHVEPVSSTMKENDDYTHLKMKPEVRMQMSSLIHELIPAAQRAAQGQTYRVVFPEGLPQTLMKLTRQPGYSSTLVGVDGKFAGTASLIPVETVWTVQNAFTAMSIVTSQYYLNEISSQMELMNRKLDQILEFLYGDKKAELLANQTFVRYAAENYPSIMNSLPQREATLSSLQQARIIAMNDIEFYLNDLSAVTGKTSVNFGDYKNWARKAVQIYENLMLSQQLFAMSYLMEVYYSQNMDSSYLDYIDREADEYLRKCEKRVLIDLSSFKGKVSGFKAINPFEKPDTRSIIKMIDQICEQSSSSDKHSPKNILRLALSNLQGGSEYLIDSNGEVYLRKSRR